MNTNFDSEVNTLKVEILNTNWLINQLMCDVLEQTAYNNFQSKFGLLFSDLIKKWHRIWSTKKISKNWGLDDVPETCVCISRHGIRLNGVFRFSDKTCSHIDTCIRVYIRVSLSFLPFFCLKTQQQYITNIIKTS